MTYTISYGRQDKKQTLLLFRHNRTNLSHTENSINFLKFIIVSPKLHNFRLKWMDMPSSRTPTVRYAYQLIKFCIDMICSHYDIKDGKVKGFFRIFSNNNQPYIHFLLKLKNQLIDHGSAFLPRIDRLILDSFIDDFNNQFGAIFFDSQTLLYEVRNEVIMKNRSIKHEIFMYNSDISGIDDAKMTELCNMISNPTAFISSPLKRCVSTSNSINIKLGLKIIIDDDVREFNSNNLMGIDNGDDIHEETVEALCSRGKKFLMKCVEEYQGDILICTHKMFIQSLVGTILERPKRYWHQIKVDYLEAFNLIYTNGTLDILFNDDNKM